MSRKSSTFACSKFNFEDRKFKILENRFSVDFSLSKGNQKDKPLKSTSPTNTEAQTLNLKIEKKKKIMNEE